MPASTGTISRVMQPASLLQEDQRSADQNIFGSPNASTQQGDRWCLIKDIDDASSLVQLVDAKTKKLLFGGNWVDIVDVEEIKNKYGQLEKGMLVRADYSGVGGQDVRAMVTGRKGRKPYNNKREINEQAMSWFRIAAPGMGIGI